MPKLPQWTAAEAERALLNAGFDHLRSKVVIAFMENKFLRVAVPFHLAAVLHPKIIKQVVEIVEEAAHQDTRSRNQLI